MPGVKHRVGRLSGVCAAPGNWKVGIPERLKRSRSGGRILSSWTTSVEIRLALTPALPLNLVGDDVRRLTLFRRKEVRVSLPRLLQVHGQGETQSVLETLGMFPLSA